MPRIEQALIDHWYRDAGVRALLDPSRDVVRGTAPPDAGPTRVHYGITSDVADQSLGGGETTSRLARIRLECVSDTAQGYEDARALADAVQQSTGGTIGGLQLRRFRGFLPAAAPPGAQVFVQACRVDEVQPDQVEESPGGNWAPGVYTVALELVVSYLGS
jgi:hypothetical protein